MMRFGLFLLCLLTSRAVAGLPPVPAADAPGDAPAGRALLRACLDAHGGAAAYARLWDVNVRLDGKWAFLAPKLQPKLADPDFRGGSEERYLPTRRGFIVGQAHHGPAGLKQVLRLPGPRPTQPKLAEGEFRAPADKYSLPMLDGQEISYCRRRGDMNGDSLSYRESDDAESRAAATLVADAYAMFLFGPDFFRQRSAPVTRLPATGEVDGHACDEVLAVLRPGFGEAKEDRVVLFIDQRDHTLRRVQFTLNGLESTQGADVHVDLLDHRPLAGVKFPTRFYERIDHPASLPAHRWTMTGFDVNRGYTRADLAGPQFTGKAAAPARPLPR